MVTYRELFWTTILALRTSWIEFLSHFKGFPGLPLSLAYRKFGTHPSFTSSISHEVDHQKLIWISEVHQKSPLWMTIFGHHELNLVDNLGLVFIIKKNGLIPFFRSKNESKSLRIHFWAQYKITFGSLYWGLDAHFSSIFTFAGQKGRTSQDLCWK